MDPTALPRRPAGRAAFVVAFVAIVIGGLAGALIGYGIVDVGCAEDVRDESLEPVFVPAPPTSGPTDTTTPPVTRPTETHRSRGCRVASGIAAVVGGVTGAAGVGIVAVLVLRAMAEWERNQSRPVEDDDGPPPGPPSGAAAGAPDPPEHDPPRRREPG
jgi:hypothetical protein